ncbi:MAG: ATP synthase F1 subunit gamma [Saprospiraceae bacterium]|uniref:ATP synthase gamma chain n=1 Tax=Candidatus Opimibacter skivensis TaxID=2982028 RepID=A0A9D7SX64_9BACT|nr:ATP synthase F1 subunit gamma [Candidatus Opimibacter skivensis]
MSGKLKEVRERMKSVASTQQITKAMKMVSAAKLRKAQEAIVRVRPYADKLNQMLRNVLSAVGGDVNINFGKDRLIQHATMVVITSNRGLAGAFNTNIIKAAVKDIDENFSAQRAAGKLTILCIGKKGYDFFRRNYKDCTIVKDYVALFENLSFDQTVIVPRLLMDQFSKGETDRISVSYSRFKNAATQFAESVQYLPVPKIEAASKLKVDYIFEPEKDKLLESLVPSILEIQFQKFLLDTHASEHGARMTAMDKATTNADDLLSELKINYNKARQESITKELSEIVGGAAALGS